MANSLEDRIQAAIFATLDLAAQVAGRDSRRAAGRITAIKEEYERRDSGAEPLWDIPDGKTRALLIRIRGLKG